MDRCVTTQCFRDSQLKMYGKLWPAAIVQIKFYWNTATYVHLHIVCFVLQGQSSGNTQPAKVKYLLSGPLQEKFLVPGFKNSLPIYYETLK